jgi:hypothetical protein
MEGLICAAHDHRTPPADYRGERRAVREPRQCGMSRGFGRVWARLRGRRNGETSETSSDGRRRAIEDVLAHWNPNYFPNYDLFEDGGEHPQSQGVPFLGTRRKRSPIRIIGREPSVAPHQRRSVFLPLCPQARAKGSSQGLGFGQGTAHVFGRAGGGPSRSGSPRVEATHSSSGSADGDAQQTGRVENGHRLPRHRSREAIVSRS